MNINRRKFLQKSALIAGTGIVSSQLPPIRELLKILTTSLVKKAHANDLDNKVNYLAFHFNGAPARWCFDQFLQTTLTQKIEANLGVATQLVGDGNNYINTEFRLVDFKGFPVPTLWNSSVVGSNGQLRPLTDLLPHYLSFRGYGSGVDGHTSNSSRQTNPVPSAGSMTGHIADQSTKLFRAIQYPSLSSWSGYNSIHNTGLSLVMPNSSGNLAQSLLSPFQKRSESQALENLRNQYEPLVYEAHKQIRFIASEKYSGLNPLNLDFNNTIAALRDGVGNLDALWNQLYSKYETIILGTIKDRSTPGFSDLPVFAPNNVQSNTFVNGQTLQITPETDLRNWFNNVDCRSLISSFALAEFVILNNYGNALEFGFVQPRNLQGYFTNSPDLQTFEFNFDQHTTGVFPLTFVSGMYFRAFGAALLELIDQLKNANVFEKTFIHLAQEFGRAPRADGSGSEHSFDGMFTSVLTGLQNDKPLVVGNIARIGGPDLINLPGTYGFKELTTVNGNLTSLTPAHVTSTLANLMQLNPNPWGNVASPLIEKTTSGLYNTSSGDLI